MFKFTKLIGDICLIKSSHLLFCCFVQNGLTLLQIRQPLFDKFCIQSLHIGKDCKLTNRCCISHIKPLAFQFWIFLFPLFGCTTKYNQIQSVSFSCIYPILAKPTERELTKNVVLYCIGLKHIISFRKNTSYIPFFKTLISKEIIKILIFLNQVEFESRINPRPKFKSYVFVCVRSSISTCLCYESDCIGFFNPLFGRQSKSIKTRLIKNLVIGFSVKTRIIQRFPNAEKFNRILIPKPFLHEGCTVLYALNHISQTNIIFVINFPNVDRLI